QQESGLALAPDRERDERRVENRHAFEVEARIARTADSLTLIDIDVRRPDQPVLLTERAGRIAHIVAGDLAERTRANSVCRTARVRRGQLEARAPKNGASVRLEARRFACYGH